MPAHISIDVLKKKEEEMSDGNSPDPYDSRNSFGEAEDGQAYYLPFRSPDDDVVLS